VKVTTLDYTFDPSEGDDTQGYFALFGSDVSSPFEVKGKKFPTLAGAISAVEDGGTITVYPLDNTDAEYEQGIDADGIVEKAFILASAESESSADILVKVTGWTFQKAVAVSGDMKLQLDECTAEKVVSCGKWSSNPSELAHVVLGAKTSIKALYQRAVHSKEDQRSEVSGDEQSEGDTDLDDDWVEAEWYEDDSTSKDRYIWVDGCEKHIMFKSEGSISVSTDQSKNLTVTTDESVQSGGEEVAFAGWYSQEDGTGLQLIASTTYFITADQYDGSAYYAYYGKATTPQISFESSQKTDADTPTIQLYLKRDFSGLEDVSTVSKVGIKFTTNYLLGLDGTDTDYTTQEDVGADEIVNQIVQNNKCRDAASKEGSYSKEGSARLNLIVGKGYEKSVVYVLGYVTVKCNNNDYTLYTGLQALTYNTATTLD
jgi:hypothetical protein